MPTHAESGATGVVDRIISLVESLCTHHGLSTKDVIGISAAGNIMLDPIVASAERNTLTGMFEHTRIELAKLGNDAGSIGAAYLVM